MNKNMELNEKISKLDEIMGIISEINEYKTKNTPKKKIIFPLGLDFLVGGLFFCLCYVSAFTYQLNMDLSNITLKIINYLLPSIFIIFGIIGLNTYFDPLVKKLSDMFD